MKSFIKYYQEQEQALGDMTSGPDESVMRMARMAASDHMDDLLELFNKLAKKDTRIKQELEEYKKKPDFRKKSGLPAGFDNDKDRVVPSISDTGSDENESGN